MGELGPWREDYRNAHLCALIENTAGRFMGKRVKRVKISAHMPSWWSRQTEAKKAVPSRDIQRKLEGWAKTLPPSIRPA